MLKILEKIHEFYKNINKSQINIKNIKQNLYIINNVNANYIESINLSDLYY